MVRMAQKKSTCIRYSAEELAYLTELAQQPIPTKEVERIFRQRYSGRTVVGVKNRIIRLREEMGQGHFHETRTPEPTQPYLHTAHTNAGTKIEGVVAEPIRTLEELVKACAIDTTIFKVVQWEAKAYQQGSKNAEGKMQSQTLYSVSARLQPLSETSLTRQLHAILDEVKANTTPRTPTIIVPESPLTEHAVSLYIPDVHIGKLAWAPETGANYDLDIAATIFLGAARDLVADAAQYRPTKYVVPIGSDMLNADNVDGTTTAGTRQDQDGRYPKTVRRAREILQELIDDVLLPTGATVQLIPIPGNHDETATFFLNEILSAYYTNEPRVQTTSDLRRRKFWAFGKVLVLYAHGDGEAKKDLPLVMATEEPRLWGKSQYREIHTGHLHRVKQTRWVAMEDQQGVIHEELASLSAPEAWHYKNAYTGSLRCAKAIVYSAQSGRRAVFERHAQEYVDRLGNKKRRR